MSGVKEDIKSCSGTEIDDDDDDDDDDGIDRLKTDVISSSQLIITGTSR